MSQLTKSENQSIRRLQELAEDWPDTLQLFSWSGALCVVRISDGEVVTTVDGIPNDGGDPNNEIINGISYLRG